MARSAKRSRGHVASLTTILKKLQVTEGSLSSAPATLDIQWATAGSTLTVFSGTLPVGMTLNSAGRRISGIPQLPGSYTITLRETLVGATNSPRDTAVTIVVGAGNTVPNVLLTTRPITDRTPMRRARQILAKIKDGVASTQLDIAYIGTSFCQTPTRGVRQTAKRMQADYGSAGSGFIAFSYPAAGLSYQYAGARNDLYTIVQSGTWSSSHYGQSTPSMGRISSSSVGAKITITAPAGHDGAATCYYQASSGAEVRYRWDGGAWTNRTIASGRTFTLAGMPATAFTFEIEVVAGTVQLAGVQFRRTANGVRVHNLGSSGSTSSQWVSMSAVTWQAAIGDLGIQAFIIDCMVVNDAVSTANGIITPEAHAANIQTLITRLRTAAPNCDIALRAPPQVPSDAPPNSPYWAAEYATALRALAVANDCDFYDLTWDFGSDQTQYLSGTALDRIDPDGTHPSPNGSALISSADLRQFGIAA